MIRNKILILLLSLGAFGFSQEGNCDLEVDKKANKLYEKGLDEIRIDPNKGRELIQEAIDRDPDFLEANFFMGNYYFEKVLRKTAKPMKHMLKQSMLRKSAKYFEEVQRICPDFSNHSAAYQLGIIYNELGEPEKSAEFFKFFDENEKSYIPERHDYARKFVRRFYAKEYLKANPVDFNPSDVKGINTEKDEFLPMLSPDNEQIFFTRRVDNQLTDAPYFEQLMTARLMKVDSFSNGSAVGGPFSDRQLRINGDLVIGKGGITITPDNKHLFVTIVKHEARGRNSGNNVDIYYSDFKDGTWTALKSIGDNVNNEGGPTWEGQPTISNDGQMIIFSTVRDGCVSRPIPGRPEEMMPSMDLYYITRLERGWSNPKSLGKVINTPGNEKTPFLHTDSKTLYFSSNGHNGMGGYDIFYSRMDKEGQWSEPENLGYPINTEEDEHGFIVSLDGKLGYFTKGVEGNQESNGLQIISFPIPEEAKPKKVVLMKGVMKDSDGNIVSGGKIEIKNTKTGEKTEAYVDENSGEYVAVMTVEEDTEEIEINGEKQVVKKEDSEPTDFILTAKKEGAAFSSKLVTADPDEIDGAQKIRGEEMVVDPVKMDKPYRLNDLTFATNSSELNNSTRQILDEFIDFLKYNADYKVKIQGHTDNVGDDQKNLTLSNDRAQSVKNYIIENGIEASRLSAKGYGETQPIASNSTAEGRAQNRRTEFILSK